MSEADPTEARRAELGRNESLFRAVNERMAELNETFAAVTGGQFLIVCECGNLSCLEQINIPQDEYARVRAGLTLFVVVPGHEDATVESVVEDDRAAAYIIVQKSPDIVPDEDAEEDDLRGS